MTMLILLVQVVLAEKIAILDFVEKDRGAQYISSALMKRDFKNLFKEYDNLELINNKVTAKAMKAKAFPMPTAWARQIAKLWVKSWKQTS